MGLWSGTKRAAKFTFVSMPLSILGVNQLRAGNATITSLWKSVVSPACPECDQGVMLRQGSSADAVTEVEPDGGVVTLYPWRCTKCSFGFLEVDDLKVVREGCIRHRNERVAAEMTTIEAEERAAIARGHRMQSRAFFGAAAVALIGFLYMLASGASFLLAVNWLSFAFLFWVFALKKSYRAWQVTTGTLFVEGAFWHWLKHEKWIT
mgnify:CR=1 FL=1